MIQKGTRLNVADNSGAKIVSCINIISGSNKKYAKTGDVILVSVKSLRLKRKLEAKVKKKEISKALVIRTVKRLKGKVISNLWFFENAVVLLNHKNTCLGTRIFGLASSTIFRRSRYIKILALSGGEMI